VWELQPLSGGQSNRFWQVGTGFSDSACEVQWTNAPRKVVRSCGSLSQSMDSTAVTMRIKLRRHYLICGMVPAIRGSSARVRKFASVFRIHVDDLSGYAFIHAKERDMKVGASRKSQ